MICQCHPSCYPAEWAKAVSGGGHIGKTVRIFNALNDATENWMKLDVENSIAEVTRTLPYCQYHYRFPFEETPWTLLMAVPDPTLAGENETMLDFMQRVGAEGIGVVYVQKQDD